MVVGGAGVFVAIGLSSADAGTTTKTIVGRRIVERTVTVERKRHGAAEGVPVRVVVHYASTTRARTNIPTAVVVRSRPVTDTMVVTRTVVQRRAVVHSTPRLVTRTVTRSEARPVTETVTQIVTETAPPVTVTETLPAETVLVTVTVKHGR